MDPVTIENVLLQLRDFLVLWVTQIVCHNRIYPENAFEERTYLDLVIYQSRVPALNDYLKSFANEMISILVKKAEGGKVHDVILLIYNETTLRISKRYIINFSQFVGMANQLSSLSFLEKSPGSQSARLDIPEMTWANIYTYLRSMMFFHIEELRRIQEGKGNDCFFKLLLNVDASANLSSENAKWVQLISEQSKAKTKLVTVGEMSVGFLCFDLHNEYVM